MVGRSFKAGTLVPRKESARVKRRLNFAHRSRFPPHPSRCDGVWGWIAGTGLERPAYGQMPLRGNLEIGHFAISAAKGVVTGIPACQTHL